MDKTYIFFKQKSEFSICKAIPIFEVIVTL